MAQPQPSWYRSAALHVRRAGFPDFMTGQTTRYDNVVISVVLALVTIPLFGFVYAFLGDDVGAASCAIAFVAVAGSAVVLTKPERLGQAREMLTATVFLLLLVLSANVGGVRSPSVIWFAVCPMVAAAGGGVARGLAWMCAGLLAMLAIYIGDLARIFPAPVITDVPMLSFIGNAGFLLLVGAFLLFYELNNASSIRRLNDAMATIQQMAISDELTGVLNRRELLRLAEQEVLRAQRYGNRLSMCMIDVDHFKSINDTYGHRAGDEVLRQMAALIGNMARSTDHFGRYGGEEFLLIMSGTGATGAAEFAGRIRETVEQLDIAALPGVAVTISIGVAECTAPQTVGQALEQADIALYRAKGAGRNRVEVQSMAPAIVRAG